MRQPWSGCKCRQILVGYEDAAISLANGANLIVFIVVLVAVILVVLVFPVLLNGNSLVGAVCEDQASFPLVADAVCLASLNQQSYVINRTGLSVNVVTITVNYNQINLGVQGRSLNHGVALAGHLINSAVYGYLVNRSALGASYLARNNGSLLNAAFLVSIVARSGQNNVVVLLNAVVPIPIVIFALSFGEGIVALLERYVNVIGTNRSTLPMHRW